MTCSLLFSSKFGGLIPAGLGNDRSLGSVFRVAVRAVARPSSFTGQLRLCPGPALADVTVAAPAARYSSAARGGRALEPSALGRHLRGRSPGCGARTRQERAAGAAAGGGARSATEGHPVLQMLPLD